MLCLLSPGAAADAEGVPPQALQAVGSLGVADVYMAWMAIGAVSDSYVHENEGYGKESVVSILEVMMRLTTSVRESLEQLLAAEGLSDADTEVITLLIETYQTLALQARSFVGYVQTGNPGEYDTHRRRAWGFIQKLYGIPEEE